MSVNYAQMKLTMLLCLYVLPFLLNNCFDYENLELIKIVLDVRQNLIAFVIRLIFGLTHFFMQFCFLSKPFLIVLFMLLHLGQSCLFIFNNCFSKSHIFKDMVFFIIHSYFSILLKLFEQLAQNLSLDFLLKSFIFSQIQTSQVRYEVFSFQFKNCQKYFSQVTKVFESQLERLWACSLLVLLEQIQSFEFYWNQFVICIKQQIQRKQLKSSLRNFKSRYKKQLRILAVLFGFPTCPFYLIQIFKQIKFKGNEYDLSRRSLVNDCFYMQQVNANYC